MFDFAWSEIALIGAVALIAIGPKDMPAAIRTITTMIKKARRMAAEFQTHVDEMVREAELGDVKKTFSDIRNFNIAGAMERAVDPDQSLRRTFTDNPFEPTYPTASPAAAEDVKPAESTAAAEQAAEPVTEPAAEPAPIIVAKADAPDWVPPNFVPPRPPAADGVHDAPAWIPPGAAAHRHDPARRDAGSPR